MAALTPELAKQLETGALYAALSGIAGLRPPCAALDAHDGGRVAVLDAEEAAVRAEIDRRMGVGR